MGMVDEMIILGGFCLLAWLVHLQAQAQVKDDEVDMLTLGGLPENLMVEILLKVPAKPAFQFKSVSKFWYSLISSPYFVNRRLDLALGNKFKLPPFMLSFIIRDEIDGKNKNTNLFCTPTFNYNNNSSSSSAGGGDGDGDGDGDDGGGSGSGSGGGGVISLAFIRHKSPRWVHPRPVASHRDLLLCKYLNYDRTCDVHLALCNPSTKEWVGLPPFSHPPVNSLGPVFLYGVFIYDISHNLTPIRGHVVVLQLPDDDLPELVLYIWSFALKEWKKLHVRSPHPNSNPYGTQVNGVPCGDSLYWLVWRRCIFAYAGNGQFHFIDLPLGYIRGRNHSNTTSRLGVCRGRLRLSQLVFKHSQEAEEEEVQETHFSIWAFDGESSKWGLEHRVYFRDLLVISDCNELTRTVKAGCDLRCSITMMGFHLYNPDLVYFKTFTSVAVCNVRSKKMRLLCKIVPAPSVSQVFPTLSVLPLELLHWPTPVRILYP